MQAQLYVQVSGHCKKRTNESLFPGNSSQCLRRKEVAAELDVCGSWQQSLAGVWRSVAPVSSGGLLLFYSPWGINHLQHTDSRASACLASGDQRNRPGLGNVGAGCTSAGHRAPLQPQLWNLILPENK